MTEYNLVYNNFVNALMSFSVTFSHFCSQNSDNGTQLIQDHLAPTSQEIDKSSVFTPSTLCEIKI